MFLHAKAKDRDPFLLPVVFNPTCTASFTDNRSFPTNREPGSTDPQDDPEASTSRTKTASSAETAALDYLLGGER